MKAEVQREENDRKELFVPILFLAFTACVFGPCSVYLTNADEFWFGFKDILPICVICFLSMAIILLGLGHFMHGRILKWYLCGIWGLALGAYIQGNYVPTQYGTLDGTAIDWSSYGGVAIWNTLLWAACLALPFLMLKFAQKVWKPVIQYVSLGILAVQIITLGVLGIGVLAQQNDAVWDDNYSLTNNKKLELSSQDNTIVFILDSYDSQYFNEFIDQHPELKDSLFQDFTYYPDTVGGATRTLLALPYILTGQPYISENGYSQYLQNAYRSAELYPALEEENYNIGIYTDSSYISPEIGDLIVNFTSERKQVASYPTLAYYLYRFTACRYLPHILKEGVWMYSGDFDAAADNSGSEGAAYTMDDALFYQTLVEEGLTVQDSSNAFRVYHLMGAHQPYTLNAKSERSTENVTLEEQEFGLMNILQTYFDQMKELRIYDHANIIVMADHGEQNHGQNPLLLIKHGSGSAQYTVSDLPVSYANLQSTFVEMAGGESDGVSIFELTPSSNAERFFYVMNGNSVVEYCIRGKASDYGSISETGNVYSMESQEEADTTIYQLGDVVYFDTRNTGRKFVVDGFSGLEADGTWTEGDFAQLQFLLENHPQEDLYLSASFNTQITACQTVGVYVDGNFLGWYAITEKKLDCVIPAEMIDDTELDVRFELPDAVSPSELGSSTDARVLSLKFSSLVIRLATGEDIETRKLPMYAGELIDFGETGTSSLYIGFGWYWQETDIRWTSQTATLYFYADWKETQTLRVTGRSYDGSGATSIYCNNSYVGTLEKNSEMHTAYLDISAEYFSDSSLQRIEFVTDVVTSPEEYSGSTDSRDLGYAVMSLQILPV